MRIHLNWGNIEKTIILIQLDKGWDWVDFHGVVDDYLMLMNSVDHRVNLIIFSREEFIRLPKNALGNLPTLLRMTHPREDKTVIVGNLPFLRPLMEMMGKTVGLRFLVENYSYTNTVEEAYDLLAKVSEKQLEAV
jgi:hypothetical protein